MRIEVITVKKTLLLVLGLSAISWADINVTQGSGKTVATITNNSREFQQVSTQIDGSSNTVQISGTVPVSVATPYQVFLSSFGTNGSTVAASQQGNWSVRNQDGSGNNISSAGSQGLTGFASYTLNLTTVSFNGAQPVVITATPPVSAQQSGVWNQVLIDTPPVQGSLSSNGSAATSNRVAILPGIAQTNYNNGSAYTQGRDAALNVGTDGLLWSANLPAIRPASYQASTGAIASAASATDIAQICGNPNDTVMVTGLRVSCTQTTAGVIELSVIKRSVADTGAFSTMTATAQDKNYAIAGSSATYFTANPTVGTAVGNLDVQRIGCMATSTASPNDMYVANWKMKPITLTAAGDCIAVNLEGTTVTGGNFTVGWDWIETTTITP